MDETGKPTRKTTGGTGSRGAAHGDAVVWGAQAALRGSAAPRKAMSIHTVREALVLWESLHVEANSSFAPF